MHLKTLRNCGPILVYNFEHLKSTIVLQQMLRTLIIPQETTSFSLYFNENFPLFLLYFKEKPPIFSIIFSKYLLGALSKLTPRS